MKKLLFLLPLLLTACSSVQFKRVVPRQDPTIICIQPETEDFGEGPTVGNEENGEKDPSEIPLEVVESRSQIPVFLAFGPNAVGYETIVETTLSDDNLISGMKLACVFLTEYGDHRLVEGKFHRITILNTELPFIVVDTPLFKDVELPLTDSEVEFCLMSAADIKGE